MAENKKNKDLSKFYPLFFTIVFVLVLFQYSFFTLESIFYDLWVKYDFGVGFKNNIVLITLDEESDEFLGEQYPYTYASHDRLFKRLVKDKPKVINYFINLLEPESDSDLKNLLGFKKHIQGFVSDGGSFRFGTTTDAFGVQNPPKKLQEFGYSLSIINVDEANFSKDGVARRAVLNVSGENTLHLWTANQYRKFKKEKVLNANSLSGAYYVPEADATFSLFKYYTSPLEEDGKISKIPFHRVVVGDFPKGFFTDKVVLVGPSYIGNPSDFVLTPFNREQFKAPKISVHAELIQALIQNKTIYEVPRVVSYVIATIIAIVLSISISRVKPTIGLALTIIMMIGIILLSYLLLSIFGYWLYTTHLILTIFVVYYIWVPFRAIGEYQHRFAIQEEGKLIRKVENLKQNFISLMSHDLKTPVAKIAGMADVMVQQNRSNPQLVKNLYSIIDSTKELNKFITSILDLTKIESQNLTILKTSKDINLILKLVVENLIFEAQAKKIIVQSDLSPLYPIQIDVNLINRVFHNLVENAIKYSGENSQIEIKSWDDDKWVYVEIKDNGAGIPAPDLPHVFDKFYRVKNDASHKIKGTGLGLYLVKYFVELHGGDISVSSEMGQGTCFKIKLVNG